MKKPIRIETIEIKESVALHDVALNEPIFAERDGKLKGMVVKDTNGWILRIGVTGGATGFHPERIDCLRSCLRYDYTFFIDE